MKTEKKVQNIDDTKSCFFFLKRLMKTSSKTDKEKNENNINYL